MHQLIPEFISQQYGDGYTVGQFEAVCLFVDTSGFTPLTSALMAYGPEGTEVLADVLAAVFSPLVYIVYEHGGFVVGYAGDAFKAVFPLANGGDAYKRAVVAAWQIKQAMQERSTFTTQVGLFDLAVKATVADGVVMWGIWEGEDRGRAQNAAYYFEGEGLARCLAADPLAEAGDVILTTAVAQHLPLTSIQFEMVADHCRLLAVTEDWLTDFRSLPLSAQAVKAVVGGFFPRELLHLRTKGEFRQVVSLFVSLQWLPGEKALMEIIFELLAQYGGYLCRVGRIGSQDLGGTLLFFWGAPNSYENDLMRALGFILDLQAKLPISLKAGLTYSQAYAGFIGAPQREEYTCYGAYVNLAARQMVAAEWGEVWLDGETAVKAQTGFNMTHRGSYRFKGFADEEEVYVLHDRRQASTKRLHHGRFVGRKREMVDLERALTAVRDGRFGGLVLVTGEAGLGKSRLMHEFTQQVSADFSLFLCQTDEILRQSLNPLRYWLRRYFKQTPETQANRETFDCIFDELVQATADSTLQSELERTRSFLASLIDLYWTDSLYAQLEPRMRFSNVLIALKTLIKAESLRRPLILCFEDVHWLDEDSQQFLSSLLSEGEGYPFMVLATTRPQEIAELNLPVSTHIALTPLDAQSLNELAMANLGDVASPALVKLLAERAEGNPFFSEQLLLFLQENGFIKRNGVWDVATSQAILLPMDVRSLLVARLDRLSPNVKQVVQTAAILGREFSLQVLEEMVGEGARGWVETAVSAAIWFPLNDHLTYAFKHALLRDAAYDMQLYAQRRQLHHQAAESLEKLYAADLKAHYGQLAHHTEQAHLVDKARFYWQKAGDVSLAAYQNGEALMYYQRALALTPGEDVMAHYDLLLAQEVVYHNLGQHQIRGENLDRLENLLDDVGQGEDLLSQRAQVAVRRSHQALTVGEYERGWKAAHLAVQLAERAGDDSLRAAGLMRLGQCLWYLGEYKPAAEALSQALVLAETADLTSIQTDSLRLLGAVDAVQGRYQKARRYFEQSLDLSRQSGDRHNVGGCLNNLGALALYEGDYAACQAYHEEALALRVEIGDQYGQAIALGSLGDVNFQRGHMQEAENYFLQSLQLRQVANDLPGEGWVRHKLGDYFLSLEDLAAAQSYFEQSLQIRRQIGNRREEAESLNSLGVVARLEGHFEEAYAKHEQALTMCQEMGDKPGETAVLYHLGLLHCRLGQWVEAQDLFMKALPISRETSNRLLEGQLLAGLVRVNHHLGHDDTALQIGEDLLSMAVTMGQRHLEADAWEVLALVQSSLYQWAEAQTDYEQALAVRQGLGQAGRTAVAHAGLAQIALAQNEWSQAHKYIKPILGFWKQGIGTDVTEKVGWLYLTCWQVLQVTDKVKAEKLLATAVTRLQQQASHIADPHNRQSFWQNVPWHQPFCVYVGESAVS